MRLFSAFVRPGSNSHGGSLRACKPSHLQRNSDVMEERGSSLSSPSLPQSWEAAISARLDLGTGWCYTLWPLPQGAWWREDAACRGAPRGEGKTAPFELPSTSLSGERAKSQRRSAPGTASPHSPVLKLSATALGSLLPARSPLKKPGAFPLPARAHSRAENLNKTAA